jgi:hypothetical protein
MLLIAEFSISDTFKRGPGILLHQDTDANADAHAHTHTSLLVSPAEQNVSMEMIGKTLNNMGSL